MENIERELFRGDQDPTQLSYPIKTKFGLMATFGDAVVVLCERLDNSQQSLLRERAHEAIGKAQSEGRNVADIKTATHLIEQACREAGVLM